jgi:DNA-binding beta-propeller fold protein YncE
MARWILLLSGVAAVLVVPRRADADLRAQRHVRRPVAAVALDAGERLAVANRDSGSISLVDTTDWSVVAEVNVGVRLADLAAREGARHLLAIDEAAQEVVVIERDGDQLTVAQRVGVARSPVSVVITPDGQHAGIASLWARRWSGVELAAEDGSARVTATVELPFAPRMQCLLPDGERVLVADAFGGRLAVIDTRTVTLEHVHDLHASNIRGLALAPDRRSIAVAHQRLSAGTPTSYDGIHWGGLIRNQVRVIPVEALLDPRSDVNRLGRVITLGTAGTGSGDPAGLAFISRGDLLAAIAGADRLAVVGEDESIVAPRTHVGRRPTAVIVLPGRTQAVVVNTLDDSLTVVATNVGRTSKSARADALSEREAGNEAGGLGSPPYASVIRTFSLGPTPEPGPRERGESLFYDARLSHDGWLSCHSCHTDGHATGGLADTLGDGTYGTPKRIPSLLGTRDANPWAWNGAFRNLHEQVHQSVVSSMQGDGITPQHELDLVQYLHSLPPAPPLLEEPRDESDRQLLARGRELFGSLGCAKCHVPPVTYTTDGTFDVGLADEAGQRKFNPPSLRGVSQRTSFFHDGRAPSLEAVVGEYGHQLPSGLEGEELAALVRFLRGL